MIDVYTWPTPNGHKVHIMLEETGLDYTVHGIDILAGDQFEPAFLKISPNNRIPAIVDSDGPGGKEIPLFESGAILIYLADKTGQFLSSDPAKRYETLQWVMFQMGNIGPMLGQAHHFRGYTQEPIQYAVDRYTNEANRLYSVMDRRLGEADYLAGEYSIADMACFPWLRSWESQGVNLPDYANVERWFNAINDRPAVKKALDVLKDDTGKTKMDDKARDILFGKAQFARR